MGNLNILGGYNANDFEDSFGLIPDGEYQAEITESNFKENAKGTGSYLSVKLSITAGELTNRTLFDNFNLVHQNQVAVDIAQQQFAGLCKAAGVLTPSDSSDLHGIPLTIIVGSDGQYNRVKRYKAIEKKAATPKGNLTGKTKAPKASKALDKQAPSNDEPNDDLPF